MFLFLNMWCWNVGQSLCKQKVGMECINTGIAVRPTNNTPLELQHCVNTSS